MLTFIKIYVSFIILFINCYFLCGQSIDYNAELVRLKSESQTKLASNITTFNGYTGREPPDGPFNSSNVNQFLQSNIPLFLSSNNDFTEVYNYRWWVVSKHLKTWFDTSQNKNVWIFSEFFGTPGHAARSGAIPAAAGHQFYETRWLRDSQYIVSFIEYWMKGYASNHNQRENAQFLTYISRPESHHFTSWMIDGVEAFLKVRPNMNWTNNMLPYLEHHQLIWDSIFKINKSNSKTNRLYKCLDLYDAQEFTIAATLGLINSPDPGPYTFYRNGGYRDYYRGWSHYYVPTPTIQAYPLAFREFYPQLYLARPSLNSYMYGNLKSLSNLYALKAFTNNNNSSDYYKSTEYAQKAEILQSVTLSSLWNSDDQFFNSVTAGNNAFGVQDFECRIKEAVGFTPFYFNMTNFCNTNYNLIWQYLGSNTGFYNTKGMSSAQISSPYYDEQAYAWNGRGWPFLNSVVNKAYANYLTNYKPYIDDNDRNLLYNLINQLVVLHGNPRDIQEYYLPSVGPTFGGATDYFHSTFPDMIIEDLIGFKSSHQNQFTINCLLPEAQWDFFYLGNIRYHGHDIDIIWKKDWNTSQPGNQSALVIWVDNRLVYNYALLNTKAIIPL